MTIQTHIDGELYKEYDIPEIDFIERGLFETLEEYIEYKEIRVLDVITHFKRFVVPVLETLALRTVENYLVFQSKMNKEEEL